ncbi:hypothetical protein PanWU01x14_027650 [Parasponia andersonii]|uniref:Uncharacterized protein n=1 Tax=Parasponia andersonii TaxID=3476 RepID=A0A2P5DWD8_PARAD|nr:hypothetical protein PanWU01x14_027650 [Parasponia andersonii]
MPLHFLYSKPNVPFLVGFDIVKMAGLVEVEPLRASNTSLENSPPTADNPRSTSHFTCFTWIARLTSSDN